MVLDNDPLVKINLKDWPKLQTHLMKDWPRSAAMYYWIINRLSWIKKEPQANIFHICCPEGDINNGLVAFGKTGNMTVYLTIYNSSNKLDKLKNSLLKTKIIDWTEKPDVSVPAELTPWFLEIMETLGHKMKDNLTTRYFKLQREKALAFDIKCPPDVYIAQLKPEDIPEIDALWPHRFENSKDYLTDLVRLNCGQGIFSKTDNSLLSWIIKFEYNDLAVAQTKKEYQRRGYAEILMRSLSKQIAQEGVDPLAFILIGNVASESIIRRIGFEVVGYCNWLNFK